MGMYLLKAGTKMQVWRTDLAYWKVHTVKEDRFLDKHEVIDAVAVHNERDDTAPMWIRRNVELGYTVVVRNGVYGLVKSDLLVYC